MERIGIAGLGRMGSAMAARMNSQGCSVTTWTRSGRSIDGIAAAPDLAALSAASDVLILSLYDDDAVASVLDALSQTDLQGKLIIETSTVLPAILNDGIAHIKRAGATAVDAPISGGPELVSAGSCGVFIGGSDEAARRTTSVLEAISGRIFHVGPLGTGLVMKMIHNAMMQSYFSGLTELLPLAKSAGLSMETTMEILAGSPAGLPMIKDRMPKILGNDKSVGFTNSATLKDNHVFQRMAHSYGLDTPVLEAFEKLQNRAINAGLGEDDPAALIRFAYDAG